MNGKEKTEKGITKWQYIYPIEKIIHAKLTFAGDKLFIWGVFDCCRSLHKDSKALLGSEIEEFEKKNQELIDAENAAELKQNDSGEQETNKDNEADTTEATRGKGYVIKTLNFLMIYGCPANSFVKDKNDLVKMICKELRQNQKYGYLCFPGAIIDLPKRFTECQVQCSATRDAIVYFYDKLFINLGINQD